MHNLFKTKLFDKEAVGTWKMPIPTSGVLEDSEMQQYPGMTNIQG